VFIAALLKWLFTALKHFMGDKLLTANAFGRGEYFLGTFAGAARFGCMVVMCLALLHAFYVLETPKSPDPKAPQSDTAFLDRWSLDSLQKDASNRSFVGKLVRQHLRTLLLNPQALPTSPKPSKPEGPVQKRKREVKEVINP